MMKGPLFVLALLVTRELAFEMVEACPIFYEIFGTVALGRRTLLDKSLDQVNATEPEKAAFGKIQDCYNEAGLTSKFLDLLLMGSITFSSDCTTYAGEDLKEVFQGNISQVIPFRR
ncbi:major allergen I polypeptide chain 2 [Camelus dromedarius]|uniref:Major allergen I polypeptide chain 2 n=3 Tax=Camelus TaxID=9836 RepID=A0A8B8TJS7_CAMFR|nr:major allergen I polypeptide chain 2-like [Camelus bactrianus]XP_010987441.1 major allergen I polypeptide chain 2-like [Camelus dromedarius]XP_032342058.1 major allergen I polypeptide chain 2 [Camelus ferus]